MIISKTIKLLTGQKFNKLTVGNIIGRNERGFLLYDCRCECGGQISVTSDHLKQGNTKSCGCLISESAKNRCKNRDYSHFIGKKFNKLTILDISGKRDKFNHLLAQCKCDCGNLKEASLSLISTNQLKSCGCYRLEVVRSKIGPLHNNWKQNKTDKERELDKIHRNYDYEFMIWSKKIKERDNFTCQVCELQKRKLTSHHLNCWVNFPEQRYDLDNGVCLCEECHRLFHKKYGLKTTKKNYEEFIHFIKNND